MRQRIRLALVSALVSGCGTDLPVRLAPPAPHDAYAAALRDAGLDSTLLGRRWSGVAAAALDAPDEPDLPARPDAAFEAAEPGARAWRIGLRQGEVLRVAVVGLDSARVFVDLFRADSTRERLAGEVALGDTLRLDRRARVDEAVVLRVQPELLASGTVAVAVETDPSLGFPVAGADEGVIRSRWGAARDGGARTHEGVDLFADRGTPVVAARAGRVMRVQETPIGGRVVWLRPDGEDVSLYYAHLDTQRVAPGARVAAGDTLGTVGNTGNAASTPPHLHFGVYGRGGAVDPEPFLVGRRAGRRTAEARADP